MQRYFDTWYGLSVDMVVDNSNNCNLIFHILSSAGSYYTYLFLLDKNLNYLKNWVSDSSGVTASTKKRLIWGGTTSFYTIVMTTGMMSPSYTSITIQRFLYQNYDMMYYNCHNWPIDSYNSGTFYGDGPVTLTSASFTTTTTNIIVD